MFASLIKRVQRINTKHLIIAAGFTAAMAAAIGLGLATKQYSQAATARDCDTNSIDYKNLNGGCGALTPGELVKDARDNNPGDLQAIYASEYGNLSPSEYGRFETTARMGLVYRNGDVVVDGQTVLTGAKSMGREKFNSARQPLSINGKTYYYSATQNSFADGVNSIPVMVMFDANGVVETVIMTACGNPVWGTKKVPVHECRALNSSKVSDDTYDFSTTVHYANGASVNKVVYDFGDGTTETSTNPAEVVRHKYAKASNYTAKVTVYFNVPGKNVVTVAPAGNCLTKVTVVKPYYMCDVLQAVALNDKKTQFRFTVKARSGNGATLKDADFTLDNTTTASGVTTKDAQGNIYKDYTFAADGKEHTVVAKVNFNVENGVQSVTCQAKVIPEQAPVCPVPGKGHLPPDSPECVENCPVPGKEQLPKGSSECVETPPELPKTGMGSLVGLFAGTSAFGAVAHRVIAKRRARNS